MTANDPSGSAEFKQKMRVEWRSLAEAWRRWHDVLEAEHGGKLHSAMLVELAGIRPGDSVLDVAGGYGEPSLAAARAVGSNGRVVCTDISREMLDFGRERAKTAGLHNIEFIESDAEHLVFEDETFDVILSRAGLMFLTDVPGTLKRLRTFLKSGGRLAASVWDKPSSVQFAAAMPIIFDELKLPPPPSGRPGIFGLTDPDKVTAFLAAAGFRDIKTGTLTVFYETDTPEQYTEFTRDLSQAITQFLNEQPLDVQERVWSKVTEGWAKFQDIDGRVRTKNQAIWVVGTR